MYAVIRTGGKQYRVAPGDVLQVEKLAQENGTIEFNEVLAVSSQGSGAGEGANLTRPGSARVLATVVQDARAKKVLVFHFKRKKQYKKLQGHRQSYTQVRINEIQVNGESFKSAH